MARLDYAELNSMIRYTMWSVFRSEPGRLGDDRASVADQLAEYLDAVADKGVVVRGVYDLTGMRADAA
jgi:hydrogen peroxide-dependent heme synthase